MCNRQRGFSLIEILVAFTILAVSVAGFLVAFADGTKNTAMSRDYFRAIIIAESRLAQAGESFTAQEQQIQGMDGEFRWQLSVQPLDNGKAGSWQLCELKVKVGWQALGRDRFLELNSLRWGRHAG